MASDEELMRAVQQGDLSAFEQIVLRHQVAAWNTACRFLNDPAEAEDVAQEAFLRVLDAASRYRPTAKFQIYLLQIVTRLCLDRVRKKRTLYTDTLPDAPASGPSPAGQMLDRERDELVREALDKLPDRQRLALILRYDQELSYQGIAAANANIGVAKAAFFPIVRFNGLAGFQSIDAGTLFDWPSRLWAVGPSLSLPLFDAGQRQAKLRASKAAYQETVARYREVVLRAFADVEDNLVAQHLLASQYEQEQAALASARKQLDIANNRYRSGLVTYLQVATAQNAALERERVVVRLRGQRFAAAVALVKSLGGGWAGFEPGRTER